VTDIVRTAITHRDRLRSEIARIEQFIRMAEELTRGAEAAEASPNLFRAEAHSEGAPERPTADRTAAPGTRQATPSAPKASESKAPGAKAPGVKAAMQNPPAAGAPETKAADAKIADPAPAAAQEAEPAPAASGQSRWGLFRGTSSSPDDLRKAIAG